MIYVMSSGASVEVAYSTYICLLMEMQWINSGSFHADEFFHGPFESVDKDVPFILLMNDGKTCSVEARALIFPTRRSSDLQSPAAHRRFPGLRRGAELYPPASPEQAALYVGD